VKVECSIHHHRRKFLDVQFRGLLFALLAAPSRSIGRVSADRIRKMVKGAF
jgi:hypothetical protein